MANSLEFAPDSVRMPPTYSVLAGGRPSTVPTSSFCGLDGPAFRAPWEAQIFALICALQNAGALCLADWRVLLDEEIQLAKERGGPDSDDRYYACCLAALEKWLLRANLASRKEISARIADWRAAYLNTPHGQPVELR